MATRADRIGRPLPKKRPPGAAWRQRSGGRARAGARAGATSGSGPSAYVLLLGLVAVLCVVGLVMVLSASSVEALKAYGSAWYFFERQVLWVGLGAGAMLLAARVDYRRWGTLALPLLVVSVAALLLVLVPGFGISVNGSTRWLGVGQWRLQPSELAKLAVLIFTASLLARRAGEVDDSRRTVRPVMTVALPVLGLVFVQPDMGTALVTACIVFALLFVAGVPMGRIGRLLATGVVGAFVLGVLEPYRRDRFLAFLHPWKDPRGIGFQAIQGQVGLASGRLTGVGLGASRAKWGFLPNAHTDFIFAIIGEEVGLIGTLLVVALFIAFAVLGVRAAVRAPDRFGALLAAGVTAWVVGQAFINMGAVVGILPITGVPLPFVSFGGSSLVLLMFGVGILLNVARQGSR
jgi:cell division protein FtsW